MHKRLHTEDWPLHTTDWPLHTTDCKLQSNGDAPTSSSEVLKFTENPSFTTFFGSQASFREQKGLWIGAGKSVQMEVKCQDDWTNRYKLYGTTDPLHANFTTFHSPPNSYCKVHIVFGCTDIIRRFATRWNLLIFKSPLYFPVTIIDIVWYFLSQRQFLPSSNPLRA